VHIKTIKLYNIDQRTHKKCSYQSLVKNNVILHPFPLRNNLVDVIIHVYYRLRYCIMYYCLVLYYCCYCFTVIVSAARLFSVAAIRIEIDISYRFVLPQHQTCRVHDIHKLRVGLVESVGRPFTGEHRSGGIQAWNVYTR